MDVLAVERRDECLLEPAVDLQVDLVALLLERLDLGDALVEAVEVLDQVPQLSRSLARFCRRLEKVEELDVLGDQTESQDHASPLNVGHARPRELRTNQTSAAMRPDAGMVMIQAATMRRATPQRTPRRPRPMPTPMIALEMTCVVETGIPSCAALKMTVAAVVSAANRGLVPASRRGGPWCA